MIGWLIAAGCSTGWLLTARWMYAKFRTEEIEKYGVAKYDSESVFLNGVMAMLGGLIFPLMLLGLIVVAKPRKSPKELEELVKIRDREIERLERELERNEDGHRRRQW